MSDASTPDDGSDVDDETIAEDEGILDQHPVDAKEDDPSPS